MNISICHHKEDYLEHICDKVTSFYSSADEFYDINLCSTSHDLFVEAKKKHIHLAIIEMSMEFNRGIEIAKELKEMYPQCFIIFTGEKIIRQEEVITMGERYYITLPLLTKKFNYLLDLIHEEYTLLDLSFKFKVDRMTSMEMKLSDIKFYQSNGTTIEICTQDSNYFVSKTSFEDIRKHLQYKAFLPVNHSTVINMEDIDFITNKQIILKTREVFSIPYKKKEQVLKQYYAYQRERGILGADTRYL